MRHLLTGLILLASLCANPLQAQDTEAPPRLVKLLMLEDGTGILRRQFFGTVVARQTVDLAFQVSGQLRQFPVLEGAPVAAGALIAELDLEPFQRRLDQAVVQKEQADRALGRMENLSSNTVSQATIDDARSAADLAEISVREAEYSLENATLRAPFDGLVATRNIANFTTVQAGTPVLRLHDISEWRVEIDVPEVLFRRAGEDPDLVIYGTFNNSDRRIPLELREFRAEASQIGQTFKITLAMLEDPGPGVLPGSSITVVAELTTDEVRAVIPASAVVISDTGETSLMLFEPGDGDTGTVRRQPVALEAGADGEFLAETTMAAGTEIVVSGAQSLSDGQTVRRFRGFSE